VTLSFVPLRQKHRIVGEEGVSMQVVVIVMSCWRPGPRVGKQIVWSCLSGYRYQDRSSISNLVDLVSSEVSSFSEHRLRVPEGVPRHLDESSDKMIATRLTICTGQRMA
jgi:hypothetical protein